MKIFKYILRVITMIIVALFICGIDSIYDSNMFVTSLLIIGFLVCISLKYKN